MALGITNAKIISGGSGGGDTVYAVSETALNVDDKVYLNKHYYDSYEASKFDSGSQDSGYKIAYCFNNGDILWTTDGNLYKYYYNSETKSWTRTSHTQTRLYYRDIRKDGKYYITRNNKAYNNNTDFFIFNTASVGITGKILRKDLALQYAASKQFKLVEIVNPETGELGQTYSTVNYGIGNYITAAELQGNILLCICSGGEYVFYDISDLTAPVLLSSGTSEIKSLMVCTGLSDNQYIFGMTTADKCYQYDPTVTKIYKIGENYTLTSADDLPSEFYEYMSTTRTTYTFNPENNVLAVGGADFIKLYKWDGREFKQLSYNVPVPTESTLDTGQGFVIFVSEDLSTVYIAWRKSTSQYVYNDAKVYKMVNNNDNWYAEDYIHSNALSLQGFATGNTNDEGLYEISTVLPKKINLTINTNVDAVVEMRGDVE